MKITSLKSGQILWEVRSHRMGNTTVRTKSLYQIKIIEVTPDYFTASWNSNTPQKHYSVPKGWRANKPLMIPTWNGCGSRLATREEIKAAKLEAETPQVPR